MNYEDDPDGYREQLLWEADRYEDAGEIAAAIRTLRELYLSNEEESTPVGRLIASDSKCLGWMVDYWKYISWSYRGNQGRLSEYGFETFVGYITYLTDQVLEVLLPEGRVKGYEDEIKLADRLMELHERYVPVRSGNRRCYR